MKNLATILSLKSKLLGKFQRFSAIDGCIEMLKNSWISKMENDKTFYEAQTASSLNEIIQFPRSVEQKFLYGDIQGYSDVCFPSASRMQFLGF